ncbi:MAG: AAA family ATPase [Proteobacteria bacterium]|nr:MAG: AAA family ATPase [Pseudomonadota bacterium]
MPSLSTQQRPYWFVGFNFNGKDDQSARFLQQGIWESNLGKRLSESVLAMQAGERIALKSSYTRKHALPFDARGETVSVMAIHAVGTITGNAGDGRTVYVDWQPLAQAREWYFFTHRATLWRVLPNNWMRTALIQFAFNQQPQEIDRFRNAPTWWERFGDQPYLPKPFPWTDFYEAFAQRLLDFQENRSALLAAIQTLSQQLDETLLANDQRADGMATPLQDICPFTVMGLFNRNVNSSQRQAIAQGLANLLGDIPVAAPQHFEAVPILSSQKPWFFGLEKQRQPQDIDTLWALFRTALLFASGQTETHETDFMVAYDAASRVASTGWNLSLGLHWIKPWFYPSLDNRSRHYLEKALEIPIHPEKSHKNKRLNGQDYLHLQQVLLDYMMEPDAQVISFPALAYQASRYGRSASSIAPHKNISHYRAPQILAQPYHLDDLIAEGSFISKASLESLLKRWQDKKNLILQGAPGTGKTWLAKRLAYALMGAKRDSQLRAVQFHANLSYEDFVRGWRPNGNGTLTLEDGPLLESIAAAQAQPDQRFVLLIEEINRGQPAQIFGEMLTLLEADKRHEASALALTYRCPEQKLEKVFMPPNLYVIGTMNIADRSLALVDFALRRRFAFVTLTPQLGKLWQDWVSQHFSIEAAFLEKVSQRLQNLNQQLSHDPALGAAFQIGHSFVTPSSGQLIEDPEAWWQAIVLTEILPLLEEYWFDAPEKVAEVQALLLAD